MLAAPLAHTFNSNGVCSVCGLRLEPLVPVTKKDGDKDAIDYYPVKNQQQLNFLAAVFNGEKGFEAYYNLYNGATFKLTNDITFGEGSVWEPIGSYTKYEDGLDETTTWHKFCGTFDGQGHTISGLKTDEHTNYAGLFGLVDGNSTTIRNVNLTNCSFKGNVAGTIAGQVEMNGLIRKPMSIERVTADSSVAVAAVKGDMDAYAGGFFGVFKPLLYEDDPIVVTNCYSNAIVSSEDDSNNKVGGFIGCYQADISLIGHAGSDPIFTNCYFGGSYLNSSLNGVAGYIGTIVQSDYEKNYDDDLHKGRFDKCYCIGESNDNFDFDANSTSHYATRNYINSGRLAYEMMVNTAADGKYYYTQKGNYPIFATNTAEPGLCKVTIYDKDNSTLIGDTIIVKAGKKLEVPFNFAGATFSKATIAGWANDNTTTEPTEKATAENDFSMLTGKPWYRYALYVSTESTSPTLNVYKENELRQVPMLAGAEQTNIMKDLYLKNDNAVTLQSAPQVFDGNYHTIVAANPLMTETSTTQTAPVEIRNLRLEGGVALATDLHKNDANRTVKITNVILVGSIDFDKDKYNYTDATIFSNAVYISSDSAGIAFYQGCRVNGNLNTKYFNSIDCNYTNVLNYMLSHNMFDTFGLRLEGSDSDVAGRFGFATDASKRIYRAKLYNQATGAESGEVLMNYDGKRVYKVEGETVGEMTEGVPAGYFAVLPVTEEELGYNFKSLATNAITKDGKANVIRLVDGQTAGFAYPSCFPGNDEDASGITITANRAEYVRNIHRDGLHESVYLPFFFTSLEIDESQLAADDKIDIAFMNIKGGDGMSTDGATFELTSLSSYHQQKAEGPVDPAEAETDYQDYFVAGVPYFISLQSTERTDETTEITFVGSEVGFLRTPLYPGLAEPLYGLFNAAEASTVANGKKVFVLGVFNDEAAGKKIEKFVSVKDTYKLKPFRSYLATNNASQSLRLVFDGKDAGDVTGIDNVKGKAIVDGKAYDIMGRRINAATAKGVYIQNGKKIIKLK